MASTVRISESAHRALTDMARATDSTLQSLIDIAVEDLRRRMLLERSNSAYAALRADPKAWKLWKNELGSLDATLGDGL